MTRALVGEGAYLRNYRGLILRAACSCARVLANMTVQTPLCCKTRFPAALRRAETWSRISYPLERARVGGKGRGTQAACVDAGVVGQRLLYASAVSRTRDVYERVRAFCTCESR